MTRVHSVLVYVCTRYLSNSITPPRLIHCYAVERCHWVSWPLHNMADWTGKLEVPVSPSTRGCNKYTYYTYWYTSDTSILFYLTRNTCKFLQYFSNFSLVYKIFSQSRDCPVHVYLCLQYITHLSYKGIIMSNPFSQFWNLIFMPPTPIPKPNSNFKLIGMYLIHTSRVFLYW